MAPPDDWDFADLGMRDTQYLTHFFHHGTAKFIPQIPGIPRTGFPAAPAALASRERPSRVESVMSSPMTASRLVGA
jgi:hypothetical protein